MTQRKRHWLDAIGQELWEELNSGAEEAKAALAGDVPLGTIQALPEEQLAQFMSMTPEDLGAIAEQVGPEEFNNYMEEMSKLMQEKLGPFAELFGDMH